MGGVGNVFSLLLEENKVNLQSPTKVLGHFHLYMVLETDSFENHPFPPPPPLINVVFSPQRYFSVKQHCFGGSGGCFT